jgi:DNA mismatch repair ATPase MutS
MTRSDLHAFYERRKISFSTELKNIKKRINEVSNLRLIVAAGFLILLYFAFRQLYLFYLLVPVLFIFVLLVLKHSRLFAQRVHLENLVKINTREIKAVGGDYSDFSSGIEFIDAHHPYTHDLDIFGEGSLYQALNRSHTQHGKKKLADALSSLLTSKDAVATRQEAIGELRDRVDFRQHVEAAGWEIDELPTDREELLTWIKQKPFLYPKPFFRIGLIVIPVVTILLVIGAFFVPQLKILAALMAAAQWAILGIHSKKVSAFHEYISRKKNILKKYSSLLYYLQQEKFTSAQMSKVTAAAHQADQKMKKLASLVSALNARANSMTTLVVNSLLLYDLQCVYRLEQWKEENTLNLQQWLDAISDTEVLNSLAAFGFNHPGFIDAEISDSFSLEATGMGHPLIDPSACVVNDIVAGNGPSVLIITGANMAGKSTFLRTLGINVVLALNGAPVFAKKFKCPLINLRTGMRTADSLKDHQSYFYAELDRLKSIMDDLRSNQPLLILLDEILKGTNSTDKQAGSIALVKQLLPHPCLALIATHDLALGELEKEYPSQVQNFHFEPNIENDQLSFDYKLKPGVAQKMNATFLMKKMGIIPT